MTNTTLNLKARESKGQFWLYNNNVFVGAWDTEYDLAEWCERKGFSFEMVVA
jgi:hypothetical protein